MTPLTFLRNLWRNAFPPYPEFPENMGTATNPAPPLPPPEPSCFAKGIAASIVREPHAWKELPKNDPGTVTGRREILELAVKHRKTGVMLRMWRNASDGRYRYVVVCSPDGSGHSMSSAADGQFLIDTILDHPLGQLAKANAKQTKEALRRQKAIEHFEQLGCPTTTTTRIIIESNGKVGIGGES